MKKKTLSMLIALVLVLVVGVGGTLAWLKVKTPEVVNTFSPSNINITLDEETTGPYKMVPGATITKDPEVTVLAGSEPCWLFVKVTKSDNYDTYLENYTMAEGWTQVPGVNDVYYRTVGASDTDQPFGVLADDKVVVKSSVTKEQMNALGTEEANFPKLTFTAYAIQQEGFTSVTDAWVEASK